MAPNNLDKREQEGNPEEMRREAAFALSLCSALTILQVLQVHTEQAPALLFQAPLSRRDQRCSVSEGCKGSGRMCMTTAHAAHSVSGAITITSHALPRGFYSAIYFISGSWPW